MSSNPRLRVRSSGHGGSGYVFPYMGDGGSKLVTNSDGEKILARTVPDDPKKALVLPGVTTVLKVLDKPQLMQWAKDVTAAKAVANIDALLNRSQDEGFRYLRFASDEARNDRAEIGTNVHGWIEAELTDGFYPEIETSDTEQMVEQFKLFQFDHLIVCHWAERTVAHFGAGYAGTGDGYWSITCLHDGPTCMGQPAGEAIDVLIDIKTSRHTFKEHFSQLVALADCEQEFYELGAEGSGLWYEGSFEMPKSAALLHIRPDDYDVKGNFIPAFCKLVPLQDRKIPAYRALFRSSLAAAHAIYELKQLGDDVE